MAVCSIKRVVSTAFIVKDVVGYKLKGKGVAVRGTDVSGANKSPPPEEYDDVMKLIGLWWDEFYVPLSGIDGNIHPEVRGQVEKNGDLKLWESVKNTYASEISKIIEVCPADSKTAANVKDIRNSECGLIGRGQYGKVYRRNLPDLKWTSDEDADCAVKVPTPPDWSTLNEVVNMLRLQLLKKGEGAEHIIDLKKVYIIRKSKDSKFQFGGTKIPEDPQQKRIFMENELSEMLLKNYEILIVQDLGVESLHVRQTTWKGDSWNGLRPESLEVEKQLIKGAQCLDRDCKVVLWDIKPANIVLGKDGNWKFIDIGSITPTNIDWIKTGWSSADYVGSDNFVSPAKTGSKVKINKNTMLPSIIMSARKMPIELDRQNGIDGPVSWEDSCPWGPSYYWETVLNSPVLNYHAGHFLLLKRHLDESTESKWRETLGELHKGLSAFIEDRDMDAHEKALDTEGLEEEVKRQSALEKEKEVKRQAEEKVKRQKRSMSRIIKGVLISISIFILVIVLIWKLA